MIYISSASVRSSPSQLSSGDAVSADNSHMRSAKDTIDDARNDEEQLLMANRRRLLARSDWLGLSATLPVHMNFRSTCDTERIGKRRRVANSTSRKGRPATRRLLTPLFEERLAPLVPVMSGALPSEEVQVRIGIDALASQTQQSPRSQIARLDAARPDSSELGPLSEEPMLLDDADDILETKLSATNQRSGHADMQSTILGARGEGQAHLEAVSGGRFKMRSPSVPYVEIATMLQYDGSQNLDERRSGVPTSLAAKTYQPDEKLDISCSDAASERDALAALSPHYFTAGALRSEHPFTREGAEDNSHNDIEDEAFWKQLMDLPEHTPSNASLHAVKSSSLHITTFDSSERPNLPSEDEPQDNLGIPSTPKGAGTGISMPQRARIHEASAEQSTQAQSPSASLRQILALAAQPHLHVTKPCKDSDEDAAWRDFVIGSQGSSDGSLRVDEVANQTTKHEIGELAVEDVSMLDVSDLGTSVVTTAGGSRFISPQTSSGLMPVSQQQNMRNTHAREHCSVPEEYDMPDHETDDMEDLLSEHRHRPMPISPVRGTIFNPKRLKTRAKASEEVCSSSL